MQRIGADTVSNKNGTSCFLFSANFGPVDCLSTRLFLDGPKIAEEFEVSNHLHHSHCFYITNLIVFPATALLACYAHNIIFNMHESPHGHVNEVKNFPLLKQDFN